MKRKIASAVLAFTLLVMLMPGVAEASWYWKPEYANIPTATNPSATTPPATTPAPSTPPAVTPPASGLTKDESTIFTLINQDRAKAGVGPLAINMTLVALARMKSQDILDNNYFAHTSPTYGTAFDMMKKAGIKYVTAGENLAKARDATWAHMRLMASEGHQQNILNPAFDEVGIGVVPYTYGVIVTEMFIGH